MHVVLYCESSGSFSWVLLPLIGVLYTLSTRHRVNRPRLLVSCLALITAAALVSHCHSGGAAAGSADSHELLAAKSAAESSIVESLLKVRCCVDCWQLAAGQCCRCFRCLFSLVFR